MISKSKKNKSGGSILLSEANERFDPACVRLTDLGFTHFYDQDFIARFCCPKDNPGWVFKVLGFPKSIENLGMSLRILTESKF